MYTPKKIYLYIRQVVISSPGCWELIGGMPIGGGAPGGIPGKPGMAGGPGGNPADKKWNML